MRYHRKGRMVVFIFFVNSFRYGSDIRRCFWLYYVSILDSCFAFIWFTIFGKLFTLFVDRFLSGKSRWNLKGRRKVFWKKKNCPTKPKPAIKIRFRSIKILNNLHLILPLASRSLHPKSISGTQISNLFGGIYIVQQSMS